MDSLNALVNLTLVGILLFKPSHLRQAMRVLFVWIMFQFVWIALRPADWLTHCTWFRMSPQWQHYLLIQFVDASYLYWDILGYFCSSLLFGTSLAHEEDDADDAVEEDSLWKNVTLHRASHA